VWAITTVVQSAADHIEGFQSTSLFVRVIQGALVALIQQEKTRNPDNERASATA